MSTGAGSTGWVSSVFNMASGISEFCGSTHLNGLHMNWENRRLLYIVREPFRSRHSEVGMVAGMLEPGQELVIESLMPSGGAVFSDRMESDYLQFKSGALSAFSTDLRISRSSSSYPSRAISAISASLSSK